MGGPSATDDMDQAHRTQAWLAVSDDRAASVSGEYFYHMQKRRPLLAARDISTQDRLLDFCSRARGVELPSWLHCAANNLTTTNKSSGFLCDGICLAPNLKHARWRGDMR